MSARTVVHLSGASPTCFRQRQLNDLNNITMWRSRVGTAFFRQERGRTIHPEVASTAPPTPVAGTSVNASCKTGVIPVAFDEGCGRL